MKFSTVLLAEHATVVNGLVSILNGGVNQLTRPMLPAPLGMTFVGIIELPPEYESGTEISIRLAITSMDESEVYGRVEGGFGVDLAPEAQTSGATTPFVVPLSNILLPRPGTFKVTATADGGAPQSVIFHVVISEPEFLLPEMPSV